MSNDISVYKNVNVLGFYGNILTMTTVLYRQNLHIHSQILDQEREYGLHMTARNLLHQPDDFKINFDGMQQRHRACL